MTGGGIPATGGAASPRGTDLRAVIEEFGNVLAVLGAELTRSVHEADREWVAVGDAFQQLAAANERIEAISGDEPKPGFLRDNCARISASLGEAIVALQYQDRLAQRIGHIRASLDHLQSFLKDGSDRSCEEWLIVLHHVEAAYRSEQARLMSAAVRPNGSAELF
jgi:hypothetical protein